MPSIKSSRSPKTQSESVLESHEKNNHEKNLHAHSPENNVNELTWTSRKYSMLSQLTPEELSILKSHTETLYKKRGECLWAKKSETSQVIWVDEGYVRICSITPDGRRFIMGILEPGEFYGAVNPQLNTMNDNEFLEVCRDAKIFLIQAEAFQHIISLHLSFALRLAYILESQKRSLQQQLISVLFKDVTSRVAALLMDFCQRFSMPCPYQEGQSSDIPMTHQEIADMIGAARQVVSGIISKFIKADIVHKHDRLLCVVNLAALQDIAENGAKSLNEYSPSLPE